MTFAIIQDEINKGGRLAVIVEIISILNKHKITPDIITFKLNLSREEILKEYNQEINFNYIQIKPNILRKLPEINKLLFHILINKKLKLYDVIINSNNTFDFLNKKINLISYIHYPRKDRVFHKKSIHQDSSGNNLLSKLILKFDKLTALLLYKISIPRIINHTIIANSQFTKKAIEKVYGKYYNENIEIIYPPVDFINATKNKQDTLSVCSLGRFHPSKRQFEQIQIAQQFPEVEFNLIGFANKEDTYFKKCNNYIIQNKIKNVSLLNNLSYSKLQETLENSTFFIHTMINEPFGIVTVQAISAGIIPIVHNSGGQKEVVPVKELRYNKLEEIKNILNHLINNPQLIKKYQQVLLSNIEKYKPNNFKDNYKKILNKKGLL